MFQFQREPTNPGGERDDASIDRKEILERQADWDWLISGDVTGATATNPPTTFIFCAAVVATLVENHFSK